MAVVQANGPFDLGMQQHWQGLGPMYSTPGACCGAEVAGMSVVPQAVMMVPMIMVPVFVQSQEPHMSQMLGPGTPSSSSGSCGAGDSESTGSAHSWASPAVAKPLSPGGSSRMLQVAERFSMVASKEYGSARNRQVAENVSVIATRGVQLSFPDLGLSLKGSQEVRSFFVDFFDRMPDLRLALCGISEDGPRHGGLEYSISGTQTEPFLPMFPVGQWVEWKFSSRYEFDRESLIRVHEIRFDFPSAEAVRPAHYQGLAQCFRHLASTAGGSRLLQRALETDAANDAGKGLLLEAMCGSVWELSLSPHGNHIVQKCVTSLFPQQVQFIVEAFRGKVAEAARNQMQSRVLERLLEYCPPQQTASLVEEALAQAPQLLMDAFGNFVMQAILEHGTPACRSRLVAVVCADADRFARDRISSNSVRRALMSGAPADQLALIAALKADPERFASLGKHKTGSFVVRELKRVLKALAR